MTESTRQGIIFLVLVILCVWTASITARLWQVQETLHRLEVAEPPATPEPSSTEPPE